MGPRLSKKLASTAPSKVLSGMDLDDPTQLPSRNTLIQDGREKLPKGGLLIKDAEAGKEYANFERTPRVVRLSAKQPHVDRQVYTIDFYVGELGEWLTCTVAAAYPVIPVGHEDAPSVAKPTDPVVDAERRKARAAHLPKFKKTKPDPAPEKADGKRVFKGKIGGKSVLFDAGDGSTVAVLDAGTALADGAKKAKRELVSQGKATPYAMFVFTKQWNAQKS